MRRLRFPLTRCLALLVATILVVGAPLLRAQRGESSLSDVEVEQLRESAYVPSDRIAVFVKFLDTRTKAIQDLTAKPRRPGRNDDLHDLFEQFTAVADELNDNLDDYGPRHRDLRRQLPKLLEATERWATGLRTPPDDDAYKVSRKIALESVRDIREETNRLIEDQRTFFAAHPEAAKAEKERESQSPRDGPGH